MRNSMHPYGGVNPLIDKMIGNAYDIVKYVARYLKEIRYVAENMESVYVAANGNRTVLTATADGGVTNPLVIPMPVGFTYADLLSVNVVAVYLGNTVTFPSSTTFEFTVTGGNVVIQMISGAAQVISAQYRVTLIHVPAE